MSAIPVQLCHATNAAPGVSQPHGTSLVLFSNRSENMKHSRLVQSRLASPRNETVAALMKAGNDFDGVTSSWNMGRTFHPVAAFRFESRLC